MACASASRSVARWSTVPLLLRDKPFGALDALTREQISMDSQHVWMEKRKTALHITHCIPEAVLLADRVS